MLKKRSPFIIALLLTLLLLSTTIFAQGDTKQVALVIQYPDSTYVEIVTLPAAATTFDVLTAAAVPVTTADFGFGPAICNINGVGNPADDCFADPDHFWAYYHLVADAWDASFVGVADYTPADRSVEGFAWSGFDASFNPTVQPPVKTFAEIEAELTPPPAEIPEPVSLLLLGSGLAGLVGYARRRKVQ